MHMTKRLQMNADFVPEGSCVGDIGCDHGYVSINLVKYNNCRKVIALDVNEGPLLMAKRNISEAGLSDIIECRLSDGMKSLVPGEVDTLLIGGMGGMLICDILQGCPAVLEKIQTLILQPQSDYRQVRAVLLKLGFRIERESICAEEKKYYFAMLARRGEVSDYSESALLFGQIHLQEKPELLKEYLEQEKEKITEIIKQLKKKQTKHIEERIGELLFKRQQIEKVLQFLRWREHGRKTD